MTLAALVIKLEADTSKKNEVDYALKVILRDLEAAIKARDKLFSNNIVDWLVTDDNIKSKLQWLCGFFWGLRAMEYITQSEHDELINELLTFPQDK